MRHANRIRLSSHHPDFLEIWLMVAFILNIATLGELESLSKIQAEFWEWRMKNYPEFSTYMNMYKYDDQITNYNYTTRHIWAEEIRGFLTRLHSLDMTSITMEEKLEFVVMEDVLQSYVRGHKWILHSTLNPVSFLEGIHLFYPAGKSSTSTRGDFENYIIRMKRVPEQIDEIIYSMREAIRLNLTFHRVSVEAVPAQIARLCGETVTETEFYPPFNVTLDQADNIKPSEKADIRARGIAAIANMQKGYRRLQLFIQNEYMNHTREHEGVGSLVNGTEYYKACLKWHLSYNITPEEVHEVGLQEVKRIAGNIYAIMESLDYKGSIPEFVAHLKNDSQFYLDSYEGILSYYENLINNRINPALPLYFNNLPNAPIGVRPMSYDGPTGSYSPATKKSIAYFNVNLFQTKVPTFDFMALTLHEASPGHHLQISYTAKADLPTYRQNTIFSFYDPPFAFPFYSAYTEGWGLYAEYLGEEMGMYKDKFELLGRYSAEMLRACRLVVDTGIHYYGWSKQRAMEYMLNLTAYSEKSVEIEVNRYITWPGQACAYKIGEIKIKQLRKMAERKLGKNFDVRDFHSVVLDKGPVPLRTLSAMVDEWVDKEMNQRSKSTSVSSHIQLGVLLTSLSIFYFCTD